MAFPVRDDSNNPAAMHTNPHKKKPMYTHISDDHITCPLNDAYIGKNNVVNIMNKNTVTTDKNFASTIFVTLNGLVNNNTSVPPFRSSAKERIVKIGMIKIK
jgi:hypothetical protein